MLIHLQFTVYCSEVWHRISKRLECLNVYSFSKCFQLRFFFPSSSFFFFPPFSPSSITVNTVLQMRLSIGWNRKNSWLVFFPPFYIRIDLQAFWNHTEIVTKWKTHWIVSACIYKYFFSCSYTKAIHLHQSLIALIPVGLLEEGSSL